MLIDNPRNPDVVSLKALCGAMKDGQVRTVLIVGREDADLLCDAICQALPSCMDLLECRESLDQVPTMLQHAKLLRPQGKRLLLLRHCVSIAHPDRRRMLEFFTQSAHSHNMWIICLSATLPRDPLDLFEAVAVLSPKMFRDDFSSSSKLQQQLTKVDLLFKETPEIYTPSIWLFATEPTIAHIPRPPALLVVVSSLFPEECTVEKERPQLDLSTLLTEIDNLGDQVAKLKTLCLLYVQEQKQ
jgi:hypothetical protein